MVWDVKALVKHILAMANVRDGGVILIGVGDKTSERQGVTDKQRSTYDLDTMRDQLAKYADPTRVWQFDGNSSTGPETRCTPPSLPDHH